MIRTLLIDDEYLALNLLEEYIKQIPDLNIVAKLKSPIEGLEILGKEQIDLLFLDIQMPALSGNNLLKTLKNPPITIFTTAYSEYALEAFDLNAIDYLLKPFSFERFLQSINKAREYLNQDVQNIEINSVKDIASSEPAFFSVKVDGKVTKIVYNEILFIEGLKEYVRIVCENNRYVILESLKNLENELPVDEFIRVHKSFIVAKRKVVSMEGNMLEIGKHKIPVSRSKKEEVVQQIFY